jgi:hypothetical protein
MTKWLLLSVQPPDDSDLRSVRTNENKGQGKDGMLDLYSWLSF